jgi:dihydropyrimidinase
MDLDLLVKNGRVVFPSDGITRADIGVKGGKVVGMYADTDLDLEKEVNVEDLKSACDYSLLEGLRLKGRPVMTIVRGQVVMHNGQITAEPGHGIYVNRDVPKR